MLAEAVVGPVGDVDDEVVGTLQLGHDAQHREQEAQVGGDRRLQHDLPVGQFLDLRVQGVDHLLPFGQGPERICVAGQEGLGRPGQILGDHREQFDDLCLDGIQLALEFLTVLNHGQRLLSLFPPPGRAGWMEGLPPPSRLPAIQSACPAARRPIRADRGSRNIRGLHHDAKQFRPQHGHGQRQYSGVRAVLEPDGDGGGRLTGRQSQAAGDRWSRRLEVKLEGTRTAVRRGEGDPGAMRPPAR